VANLMMTKTMDPLLNASTAKLAQLCVGSGETLMAVQLVLHSPDHLARIKVAKLVIRKNRDALSWLAK